MKSKTGGEAAAKHASLPHLLRLLQWAVHNDLAQKNCMATRQSKNQITINRSELSKIPFIDAQNIGGRSLTTLTFYEEEKWHMWLVTAEGLLPLSAEPAEADYFSRTPEKETDVCVEFLDFMAQRACWIDALQPINGLRCDIHNLGASLAKIDLFYEISKERKSEIARFVSTELEYIFSVCRSLFDLLQKTISRIWGRSQTNPSRRRIFRIPSVEW